MDSISTLFLHSVLALICALFFSYPFWLPLLCSSINSFSFVYLPDFNKSFFFNPKLLFVVGNAIIIFLIGELKLSNSPSSPATEIYNHYVRKSQKSRELSRQMEKNEEQRKLGIKIVTEESVKMIEKEVEEREEEEEESGLETEELNKRVEDFIARVNRQRLVEARLKILEGDERE